MRRFVAIAALALLTLASDASAWLMASNSRIDRALYAAHGPREVLAGRIASHDVRPGAATRIDPPDATLAFDVTRVVLGSSERADTTLRFSTRSFDWPGDLVPLTAGTRCIVILDSDAGHGGDGSLLTVMPWSGRDLPVAETRGQALRILGAELSEQLLAGGAGIGAGPTSDPGATAATIPTVACRRELAILAAPLLTAERATEVFGPLLDHPDIWLRRAAIGGLALAAPTDENLDRAAADLRAFAESTPADAMLQGIQPGHSYAAYPWFFRSYDWLATDWSTEERERLTPHVRLHRVVAAKFGAASHIRYRYGIQPLCVHGDRSDVSVLYAYVSATETQLAGPLEARPFVRVQVLRRLAELLGLEPFATQSHGPDGATNGIAREAEQMEAIRAALRER